jgi:hypothetical protein
MQLTSDAPCSQLLFFHPSLHSWIPVGRLCSKVQNCGQKPKEDAFYAAAVPRIQIL